MRIDVADLALFAWGFGVLPIAAILLFVARPLIADHRAAAWGLLAGVVAFLGVSHAMAAVLVNHSLFADPAISSVLAFMGFLVGAGIAWTLLETSAMGAEPVRILAAVAVFLALHSIGDGFVLGSAFVGGLVPIIRLDVLTVGATVTHRFVEGALVVVAAIAAKWKPAATFVPLLASLAAVPAAYAPPWIFTIVDPAVRGTTVLSISTFLAAAEATFGLILLVRAILPIAASDRGGRWLLWTIAGFVGISLVHFLVE